jgi:lambda repressor-like predicted transcriptional regulator
METRTKSLLESDTTHTKVLFDVVKRELGDFIAWEPESIWTELKAKGYSLSDLNKSKILAAITLKLMPAFYWDAHVFELTALALNDVEPNPEIYNEAYPEHLAWAVIEAGLLTDTREFMHEPIGYTATVLHRAGFVVAPEELSFCQSVLDSLNNDSALKKEVMDAWRVLPRKDIHNHPFDETPVGVQLARLASVAAHVESRRATLKNQEA